jgi:hypothetical protein
MVSVGMRDHEKFQYSLTCLHAQIVPYMLPNGGLLGSTLPALGPQINEDPVSVGTGDESSVTLANVEKLECEVLIPSGSRNPQQSNERPSYRFSHGVILSGGKRVSMMTDRSYTYIRDK